MKIIIAAINDYENDIYERIIKFIEDELSIGINRMDITKNIKSSSFYIDILKRKVITKDSKEIALTSKEFDLFYLLVSHKEQVFSKEQLYEQVWNYIDIPDPRNMTSFIRKLRKKIEKNPNDPKHIITVWGVGYKFTDNE